MDEAQRMQEARDAILFLNVVARKRFSPLSVANTALVRTRLSEPGVTPKLVRQVILNRWRKWKDDPKMVEYLRPATLFARRNFWQYAGEVDEEKDPDQLGMVKPVTARIEPPPESDLPSPQEVRAFIAQVTAKIRSI